MIMRERTRRQAQQEFIELMAEAEPWWNRLPQHYRELFLHKAGLSERSARDKRSLKWFELSDADRAKVVFAEG